MKKVIAYITLLCYLLVTSGVIVNTHYCMNNIASVHLFKTAAKVCSTCGMDTHDSDGCCRDEVKIVKLEQDQYKIPVTVFKISSPEIPYSIPSGFITTSFYNGEAKTHFYFHSPPLLSGQDTYILNNVFRI